MTPELRAIIVPLLEKHEGVESCLYLDSAVPANVTTGVGHLCASSADVARLPFFRTIDGKLASRDEIVYAWAALRYQDPSLKIKLKRYSALFLHQHDIESLLQEDLLTADASLRRYLPGYEQYPLNVQAAMFDMTFNLGSLQKFPKCVEAVAHADWPTAARECVRQGIGSQRNQDTQALLLSAVAHA